MAKQKQVNSSPDFHSWLESLTQHYLTLTDEEKNETIDQLITSSGPSQLCHLWRQVDLLLYRDFMRLLPPELREYLLSFLDGKTLITCCRVSRFWNEAISSSPRVWQNACRRSGFIISDDQLDNCDGNYWKSFFIMLMRRCHQMKNYESFTSKTYDRDLRRVTAVYYHCGKVAAASDSKTIKLWDCAKDHCILTLRTDASISCLKFDEHYLLAASYLGHMVLWDVCTGERLTEYMRHSGAILSFDFSLALNVVVSGSADTKIKIWALPNGQLYRTIRDHSQWVLKVILTPYPAAQGSSNQEQHLLISMDKSCIYVRLMSFVSVKSKPEGLYLTTLYSIPVNATIDLALYTPGLYFDGKYLHYVKNLDGMSGNAVLCQWDIKSRQMVKETNLKQKVKALLAIGQKYIAFLSPWQSKTTPNFSVLDRDTLEKVTFWHLPPSRPSTPDHGNFSFGECSWLDGLDGKNDKGVLLAFGTDDNCVYILKWTAKQAQGFN